MLQSLLRDWPPAVVAIAARKAAIGGFSGKIIFEQLPCSHALFFAAFLFLLKVLRSDGLGLC